MVSLMVVTLKNGIRVEVEADRETWKIIKFIIDNMSTENLTKDEFWSLVELLRIAK